MQEKLGESKCWGKLNKAACLQANLLFLEQILKKKFS
jgi:hypothetical protein